MTVFIVEDVSVVGDYKIIGVFQDQSICSKSVLQTYKEFGSPETETGINGNDMMYHFPIPSEHREWKVVRVTERYVMDLITQLDDV